MLEDYIEKIINADCMDILKQLPDKCIDAIICDPPYNINYQNNKWDNSFDIEKVLNLCERIIKDNGNIIIFQGWSNVCETKKIMDKYWNIQNWIIWDRIKGRGAIKNLTSTREDILWYCNGNNPTFNKVFSNIKKVTSGFRGNEQKNRTLSNVWYDISPLVSWGKEKVDHPTQKPLKLIERIVSIFSNKGDVILDFTSGSGTTAIACHNLKRQFICIEKDYDYWKVSVERLENAQAQLKLF